MNQLRISVAMCTYNGARYLQEQLESIAAQNLLPDELIICDDRSSDGTSGIIQRWASRAPFPVRLFINEVNLGSSGNFEKAIRLCGMELIVLSDQDDVWHPQRLEWSENMFRRSPSVGAVFSDAELIDEHSGLLGGTLWDSISFDRRERKHFAAGHALEVLLKHYVATGATMAFRREFRDLVLPIPPGHVHDSWTSILIASVADIGLMDRPMIRYRCHGSQQIGPGQKLTFTGQITQSRRTDPSSYLPEADRLRQVCERLKERSATFRCPKDAISQIQEKIGHRETRARFPKSRLLRLPILLREVATLRYWRYSRGFRSVAKDLFM